MVEKIGLDLDKLELVEAPYNVTKDPQPMQFMTMADIVKGAKIDEKWKTPAIDAAQIRDTTTVENIVKSFGEGATDAIPNMAYGMAIETASNPLAAYAGYKGATTAMGAVKGFLPKLAAGMAGAAAAGVALDTLSPTELARGDEYTVALNDYAIAKQKYVNDEISKDEYDKAKKRLDAIIQSTNKHNLMKNEMVENLQGREYPISDIADNVIAFSTDRINKNREFRNWTMAQRGQDPNGFINTIGSAAGNMTPLLVGGAVYASGLRNRKLKQIQDTYVLKGTEFVPKVEYEAQKYSRKQIAEKTQTLAEKFTSLQMQAEYATETAQEYLDRTGDRTFANFTPTNLQGAMAAGYGAVGAMIEFELGGVEALVGSSFKKVGLKTPIFKAGVKTATGESAEEFVQGLTEFLSRKIDGTNKKTWGEALTESLQGAMYGAILGGTLGTAQFHANRRNLINGIKRWSPKITTEMATEIADNMIETSTEAMSPQHNAQYEKLKQIIKEYYSNVKGYSEAQLADIVESTAQLEFAQIVQFDNERGIKLEDDPLFSGVVNELGYFRTGIPLEHKSTVESYLAEIKKARDENNMEKLDLLLSDNYKREKLKDMNFITKKQYMAELAQRRKQIQESQQKQAELEKQKKKTQVEQERQRKQDIAQIQKQQAAEQKRKDSLTKLQREVRIENATTEALRNALLEKGLDPVAVKTAKRSQLIRMAKKSDIDPNIQQRTVIEAQQEQEQKQKAQEPVTPRKLLAGQINRDFANRSGIMQAWGYNKKDIATYKVFRKDGGFSDWDEILEFLQTEGLFQQGVTDTADINARIQDIVLNNRPLTDTEAELDAMSVYDKAREILPTDKYNVDEMTVQEINDAIQAELTTPQEFGTNLTQEQLDQIPDDIPFQESFDIADENARLDDMYPAYTGETISIDEQGNIYFQQLQSKKRGAYAPYIRTIARFNTTDASTLSHELAHDWFEQYVNHYNSDEASKEFKQSFGLVLKALGVDTNTKQGMEQATEIYARTYEAWIMNKKDWTSGVAISDKEKDAMEQSFKQYQSYIQKIYASINNPYFIKTFGDDMQLKPEITAWFDKMTEATDIDAQVRAGKITPEQAQQERMNQIIDSVIENGVSKETERTLRNVQTLNDTSRYEVEKGNKNSINNRISELAKDIDDTNMILKKNYDTHRDMIQVAKDADEFVQTNQELALDIINGNAAERGGLFKEDLYTALERKAAETSDFELLQTLSETDIANGLAKELGQRVAGFRNYLSSGQVDIVSMMNKLNKRFTDITKDNKEIQKETDAFIMELNKQDEQATQRLDEILKEMECK